MILTNHDIGCL